MTGTNWYVVHTKPRQEKVAVENLERQGYITYCPETVQPKRLRQRWHKVIEPLFPRYIFMKLNIGSDDFSPIRSTFGVVGLVRFGSQPAVIPDSVIKNIQYQEKELQAGDVVHPKWQKGDTLQILDGPFAGLKGIFLNLQSADRVILLLNILGQLNRFTIPVNSLSRAV